MVACSLDYEWRRYVIAALISLFGGVVILLPVRLAWHLLERRRRRRRTNSDSCVRSLLCRVQSRAEDILAGNTTVNKIIVSSLFIYLFIHSFIHSSVHDFTVEQSE